MAVECRGVSKSFGPTPALSDVDLSVRAGGITGIVGPSGCGKTSLLRLIAGFDSPDAGTIQVQGCTVASPGHHVAPERRRVGVVPQSHALFPHLDVAANVGYGLSRQSGRRERVQALLSLCHLDGMERRLPHELSGGEQQRVALARALAPRPAVLLLDEPFSNLDALLRGEMRREVATILRESAQTTLLVTHDRGEALSMADQLVVLRAGRVVQQGSPDNVYRRPADAWVATFMSESNLLSGWMVRPGVVRCALGELAVAGGPEHGEVDVAVRPEQLRLVTSDVGTATVRSCEYFGHEAVVRTDLDDGTPIVVRSDGTSLPAPGARVELACAGRASSFPPTADGLESV